jgi:DNA mismatch endonuclease, patch repair protein
MSDVFTKQKRSEVMARIRGKGNKETELALMKILRRNKIKGWRRHRPIFGKPDFVFPKEKVVVLVDGCFWHGCPKHSNMPQNNRLFWEKKLLGNKRRDRLVNRTLKKMGWKVVRIWEHELRDKDQCSARIKNALRN